MPLDSSAPLKVEEVNEKPWRLLADLRYQGKVDDFVVPAGTTTDFASVPRMFTWLVPTSGKYTKAAVLHDYLCETGLVPRNDADGVFRRALRESGVPTVRRYVIWGAVRLAAGFRGAKVGDVIGIVLLALVVVPLAAPIAIAVLGVLAVLSLVEILVWLVLRAFGAAVPGPFHWWWT
ncbi:MAG: hypothetical protein AMXMBFR80_24180 [Dehalococcoidia bacterium]